MEAADEDDQIVHDTIEKAVRKPANESSTGVSMDDRVAIREGHDRVHHSARFGQELLAESASLSLIPARGLPPDPQPLLVGICAGSPRPSSDPRDYLIPRNADWALSLQIIQTMIEFGSLAG